MDRGVAHWVFEWAERRPSKVAAIHNDVAVSYLTFAQRIALTRGYFAARGMVGEGSVIVAVRHIMDFWVVSLALRSLGLTTMPVGDAEVAANAGLPDLRCVVKSPNEAWPGLQELCADRGWTLIEPAPQGEPPLGLDPQSVTVQPGGQIIQTSGTTGVYKKVLIDASFEEAHLRNRQALRGVSEETVDCAFSYPPWTGAGYKAPACAWMSGATVFFWQHPQPHLALLREGITHLPLTPPMLAAILAAPPNAFPRRETLQVIIASGTITQAQIDETKARISPHLINRIGATESLVFASTRLDTPEDHRWHIPVPGDLMEIVDEFDQPTPVGQVGRIRVSTVNAPNAYLHDEEATRAFFKDGFFYPGDLAIMRADGRFALEGRVSDVINVQGFKISPAPLEDAIREALGISGACLFTMQDEQGVEGLHLIVESGSPVSIDRLTQVLELWCETWGFPSARLHYLAALPRNPNGKMLRAAARQAALAAQLDATDTPSIEIPLAPSPKTVIEE
jgi:acyl-CoA synthetase (AMP-forming)/AMP-acid ligase II